MRRFSWIALTLALLAACRPCPALQEDAILTREQAEKDYGVKIHSTTYNAHQAEVWLDFKPKGKLKGFLRVELEIKSGDKTLVDAPLLTTKPTADSLQASFYTDPVYLSESVLTIVVQYGAERVGYALNVKDFVDLQPAGPDARKVLGDP